MHRFAMRVSRDRAFVPAIPMVVVGALRAGGSGKTSVTLELARIFLGRGLRVAILAYRMGRGRRGADPDFSEVGDGDDWRLFSEEAVMLRRDTGARVFATRNRAYAWKRLHQYDVHGGRSFDLILSDDGFQDPRLDGAFRILLEAPGERPGLFDLLPGGHFRETRACRRRADLILQGPYQEGDLGEAREGASAYRFVRRIFLPQGLDRGRRWIAASSLGENSGFLACLRGAGINPVAVLEGRNHAAPPLGIIRSLEARFPGAGILCTRKDGVRWEGPDSPLPDFRVVDQEIRLETEIMDRISAYFRRFRGRAS